MNANPTIVFVHGAFADASSWNGVIELLQSQGLNVVAPQTRFGAWAQMLPTLLAYLNKSVAQCCLSVIHMGVQ